MVKDRLLRTGDGSHSHSMAKLEKNDLNDPVHDIEHFWGYGDSSMTKEDLEHVKILKKTEKTP
jgi:hypothetical protein